MALRSFAGGALFSEVFGSGPPGVLALHGWGRRGTDFKRCLVDLPSLAPDLPGFGASPVPDQVIGAQGYADIVAEMLPFFDRPPVLVGHSFGGRVAVNLAANHPDSVGPVLLTGVPVVRAHPHPKPSLSYRAIRSLHKIGIVSDKRMEAVRQERGSADYRAASGVMRNVLVKVVNESYEAELADLKSPVLLLWGAEDREVPVSVARTAARIIDESGGAAQLEVLEGVGHHVPTEAPEALRQAIDSMLG